MREQRGFSLLEVLVAFFILSLSLGVLYEAFGGGLSHLVHAQTQDRATILAESLLALHGRAQPFREGSREGTSGPFRWRVEVRRWQGQEDDYRIFRPYLVRVVVSWLERGRLRRRHLQTLRLGRR